MSGLAVIVVIVVLVVAVVIGMGLRSVTRRQNRSLEQAAESGSPALRYRTPEGQDVATLVATLQSHGHDAVTEGDNVIVVNVTDPEGDRARVRALIEQAPLNPEGDRGPGQPVRFVDEEGTAS